ncbi:serine/arginine repetitive matrix protein 2-like [Triticum dicoccoides]|uniref:serine/arginine repetitive matrix protein 2-like n=1 Tax=Triticum dicoccoides TaxID=85692 RepID=UPI00188FBD4F|nr:serine/arginine repetitive matrix protein 2-like [Triticum dicoccoides]
MYNGIGLQSARGSGTNGHVQTNKFFIQPRTGGPPPKAPLHSHDDGAGGMRKPNKEILEHDRRRQVELRLVELRDALEEQGYTEAEIEERLEEARKQAELEAAGGGAAGAAPRPGEGFTGTQSHHVAARKEKKLEAMRAALGLDDEVGQKKSSQVDSDPESGELVSGKAGF